MSKRLLNRAIVPLNIKIKNKPSKLNQASNNIYQQINMDFFQDLRDNKSRTTLKNTSHSQSNQKTHNKTPGDFISYDSNSILQDLKIFDQITQTEQNQEKENEAGPKHTNPDDTRKSAWSKKNSQF